MLPVACSLRVIEELMIDPINPPSVKTAVAAEYRVEVNPRQSGNAPKDDAGAALEHVMDDSGKLSSEMW
jgi:hypothetical protein